MSLRKQVNLIIYRFREQGLEVFFLNDKETNTAVFPQGDLEDTADTAQDYIELDPVSAEAEGTAEEALAVEGDWHEIPSLKSMLYQDAVQLKEKLKEVEAGTYISIKDALKRALPQQYAFLRELKDILNDRNSLRDL